MNSNALHLAQVVGFFDALEKKNPPNDSENTALQKLQSFLSRMEVLLRDQPLAEQTPKVIPAFSLDFDQLKEWFQDLTTPIADSKKGAFGFNPWTVANVKRDEVKNSFILAWLLNPSGSHGLGSLALNAVLGGINHEHFTANLSALQRCIVRTESNPDGNRANRVDIEIDAEHFYLLIEVKIDAPEGTQQISRYGDLCTRRAKQRPWHIIFLTPNKAAPKTAEHHAEKVSSTSWFQVSTWIAKALKQHIHAAAPQQTGRQEVLAQESVKHFLKHICNF